LPPLPRLDELEQLTATYREFHRRVELMRTSANAQKAKAQSAAALAPASSGGGAGASLPGALPAGDEGGAAAFAQPRASMPVTNAASHAGAHGADGARPPAIAVPGSHAGAAASGHAQADDSNGGGGGWVAVAIPGATPTANGAPAAPAQPADAAQAHGALGGAGVSGSPSAFRRVE
jgi:hypothetical protein